jgi:hypothetical protein
MRVIVKKRPMFARAFQRRVVVVAMSVAVMLPISGVARGIWSDSGSGAGVIRTGTFEVTGPRPTVTIAGQDVIITWAQRAFRGTWLSSHPNAGYVLRRYDHRGRPYRLHYACSVRNSVRQPFLRCVDHDVPQGSWEYGIAPFLGGWSGTEGPRNLVTVEASAGTLTLNSPISGTATRDARPAFGGVGDSTLGALPLITVTLVELRTGGEQTRTLTAPVVEGRWSVRPTDPLADGAYRARVEQAHRDGQPIWTATSTFRVDTLAPSTTDNTAKLRNGWHRTEQTVTLSPVDPGGSGVERTHFTTDGSTPTIESQQGTSVTLKADGIYLIRYFSVDRAGNTEEKRAATSLIRIDRTAPDAVRLGPLPEIVTEGQELEVSGSDAQSGVGEVTYEYCPTHTYDTWTSIGSSAVGPRHTVEWRHQPEDGAYWIRARIRDQAGNAADTEPRKVTIGNSAPGAISVSSARS